MRLRRLPILSNNFWLWLIGIAWNWDWFGAACTRAALVATFPCLPLNEFFTTFLPAFVLIAGVFRTLLLFFGFFLLTFVFFCACLSDFSLNTTWCLTSLTLAEDNVLVTWRLFFLEKSDVTTVFPSSLGCCSDGNKSLLATLISGLSSSSLLLMLHAVEVHFLGWFPPNTKCPVIANANNRI